MQDTWVWSLAWEDPLEISCVESSLCCWKKLFRASLVAQLVKNAPAMQETGLGPWEDPLEKAKAMHSSTLAWRIPWTVQFMGSQRVGHD